MTLSFCLAKIFYINHKNLAIEMKMTCGIIYMLEHTATKSLCMHKTRGEKKNNTSKSSCIYRIWALHDMPRTE